MEAATTTDTQTEHTKRARNTGQETCAPPPTIEHMLYEHTVIHGLLVLAEKRILRGVGMPEYVYRAARNLGEAYLMTIQEHFPKTMDAQYREVEEQLDRLIGLYEGV
ncbi:hypothetical protein KY363_00180 [Candidatus Woesearchaeota archaeon]|nr:hypothetical protein [Candidatus Woesearchaeota archaeon]